ncbi:MAG TPA: DUF2288 family protein [Alcanivoracaceae bacterium]|nr:DUF2288 family protein [Alcanivoracaceae bacterium]
MSAELDELTIRLNSETATIAWTELQRFFAQGRTLHISPTLDLVQVAKALVEDDTERMTPWVEQELVQAVSDEQSRTWLEQDAVVWSVVIPPYVLVQPQQ